MVKILVVSIRHPTKTVFGKCITTYPQRVSRNGTEAFIYVNKASSMLLQRFASMTHKVRPSVYPSASVIISYSLVLLIPHNTISRLQMCLYSIEMPP